MVGLRELESLTSCVSRSIIDSKVSIVFRQLLTFTTIWGICSSLDSNPGNINTWGSDTVLAQPESRLKQEVSCCCSRRRGFVRS
jgi:hypothetical protein